LEQSQKDNLEINENMEELDASIGGMQSDLADRLAEIERY